MTYLNIANELTLGSIPGHVQHTESYLHTPGFQGVIQKVYYIHADRVNYIIQLYMWIEYALN